MQDESEINKIESELHKQISILEMAPDSILTVDTSGIITYANSQTSEMFAYEPGEILGKPIEALIPSRFHEAHLNHREEYTADPHTRPMGIGLDLYGLRKNGDEFPVEIALGPIWVNGGLTITAIIRDVTDRKRTEEEIKKLNTNLEQRIAARTAQFEATLNELENARSEAERQAAELQSFVSSMADGMSAWDAKGNLIFINDIGKQIMGVPLDCPNEELQDKYELRDLNDKVIPRDKWSSSRALKGEQIRDARMITITPWKKTTLSYSAAPIRDASGRVIGATSVFRDVSDQVELENKKEELYEREHHIAQFLQSALVPPMTLIEIEGCKAALRYEPALREAEVGGDFYDVFELSDGRAGIVIGDIAGKGLSAAVHVAAAKHAIRSYAYLFNNTAAVMNLVNEALCKTPMEDKLNANMLTAFFAVVDPHHGTLAYTNAGHEPPIIRHSDGRIEEMETTGDLVLGIEPASKYTQITRQLEPGDTIVMVTDGITEARPSSILLFGSEGIVRYLSEHNDVPFQDIPSGLLEAARNYGNGMLQDDAAIVAFQCDMVNEEIA